MERCLDCDCTVRYDEQICQFCGANTGFGKSGTGSVSRVAELLSGLGRILLFFSIVELLLSQFIPIGPRVGIVLCLSSCALMFNNAP
jgi:hypothetical protein